MGCGVGRKTTDATYPSLVYCVCVACELKSYTKSKISKMQSDFDLMNRFDFFQSWLVFSWLIHLG